jgi:hypothetical protein
MTHFLKKCRFWSKGELFQEKSGVMQQVYFVPVCDLLHHQAGASHFCESV